jgi:hypothetical protein
MTPGPQNGFGVFFFLFFSKKARRAILLGVLQILTCRTWFLRGKSWWICGENVAENDRGLAVEKHANFLNFIFGCKLRPMGRMAGQKGPRV